MAEPCEACGAPVRPQDVSDEWCLCDACLADPVHQYGQCIMAGCKKKVTFRSPNWRGGSRVCFSCYPKLVLEKLTGKFVAPPPVIVDPNAVAMEDLENLQPGKVIRVKRASWFG